MAVILCFVIQMIRLDESSYEKKLKGPLACLHCRAELNNMPRLKEHLKAHFEERANGSALLQ